MAYCFLVVLPEKCQPAKMILSLAEISAGCPYVIQVTLSFFVLSQGELADRQVVVAFVGIRITFYYLLKMRHGERWTAVIEVINAEQQMCAGVTWVEFESLFKEDDCPCFIRSEERRVGK